MRRKAAMIGSTSRYSGSKVLGLTVPSLRAWLLPCVRVTVISLGPAMAGRYSGGCRRIISLFCRPRASGDPYAVSSVMRHDWEETERSVVMGPRLRGDDS